MPSTRQCLTIGEVARISTRLAGRRCSERQVRHLLVTCGLGTDARRRNNGETRLYGTLDVALVRLALELEREGVSPWASRVVLTYLRNDLVRAWKAAAPLALAVHGIKGSLEPALKARPQSAVAWVSLRSIWRGIDSETARVCEARSTVWMWRDVSTDAVPRTTV